MPQLSDDARRTFVFETVAAKLKVPVGDVTEETKIPGDRADEVSETVSLELQAHIIIAYDGTTTVGELLQQVGIIRR